VRIVPFIAAVSTLAAAATANPDQTFRYIIFWPAGIHGQEDNPNVDGVAMMRYNSSGVTRVNVVVHGLQPQATYGIKVGSSITEGGYLVSPYGLNTNSSGTANFSGQFLYWVAENDRPEIVIFVNDPSPFSDPWLVTLEELRARSEPL
jgi:hypothetical protein